MKKSSKLNERYYNADIQLKQDEILYELHTTGRNSKHNASPLGVSNPSPHISIYGTMYNTKAHKIV